MEAKENESQRALIYCRVSTRQQKSDGSGLQSQEHRCRDYAAKNNMVVEAVFPDDASGGGDFMKRPGMMALLAWLDAQAGKKYVVIFDDLKRFARDTEFHIKLRRELQMRNARVECLNFRFEDTPEGRFIETIFAAHGELEREQNGRQVKQKMRARVEQGFWVFHAPYGFKYDRSKRGGKVLVRDEPVASIVQEAMEGYASGRFQTQVEVQRFLESKPQFPKDFKNGTIRFYKVTRMLKNPLYAGFIEVPRWNITMREGQHDGLISVRTYHRIQERLKANALAPARKDINNDFVMRGFIECGECARPLTSCWSKSKSGKKHPYYRCYNTKCGSYGKSIPRATLEGEVETVIRSLQPTPPLVALVKTLFKDAWDQRHAQLGAHLTQLKREEKAVADQIEGFLERIVEADSPTVIKAYERKLKELETKRLMLVQDQRKKAKLPKSFDESFELAMSFLANPWKLWENGDLLLRKTVLRLAFLKRPAYCRDTGSLNTKKTFLFNMLAEMNMNNGKMVLPERIELSTSPLPRECSTTELRQQPDAADFCHIVSPSARL